MIEAHVGIIKLGIAYTLLGAFIFTVAATCLSLIGLVRFTRPKQQNKLFGVLIVELVVICIGAFADLLQFDPIRVQQEVERPLVRSLARSKDETKSVEAMIAAPTGGDGLSFFRKGAAAEQVGNRNEALEAYTEAILTGELDDRQLSLVYFRRGSVRGFLGDSVKGIQDFSKSIELNDRYGAAYSLRGYLYGVVGQYESAEKDHRAALDLAKYEKGQDYLPWVLQDYADLWRRRGEFEKALEYCAWALRENDYATVYFRRAWIFLDMGRPAQARAEFNKFIEAMKGQDISYELFWADERGAIDRLRELR